MDASSLDRYITGNYGEDQFQNEAAWEGFLDNLCDISDMNRLSTEDMATAFYRMCVARGWKLPENCKMMTEFPEVFVGEEVKYPFRREDIPVASLANLKRALFTCDGQGEAFKQACLEEIIRRIEHSMLPLTRKGEE